MSAPSTRLRVRGGRPLRGSAPLPGDKSLSHRVLLLAAIAEGETEIEGLSRCGDVDRSRRAVERLGVAVRDEGEAVVVVGRGLDGLGGPALRIDCGDSGTTMRLLAGLLAGQAREVTLDGSPGLRARPMTRIEDPLRRMGADLRSEEGHPPLRIRPPRSALEGAPEGMSADAAPLRAVDHRLSRASAQVGSALLLAGLRAAGRTTVRYPAPVRDHTERMLSEMGAPLRWSTRASQLDGPVARLSPPGGGRYALPADPSAAAFPLAAAALLPGSDVVFHGLGLNPGRCGFFDILQAMGAALVIDDVSTRQGEPRGALRLRPAPLRGLDVGGTLVPRSIDELPLLAVLASQARGRTVLRGAAELRVKESDRIDAIVEGLGRMGARIEARPDGFVVDGPTPLRGAEVEGRGDHRIVMALAVAGLVAEGETWITDGSRPADSFPGFVAAMTALGAEIERV